MSGSIRVESSRDPERRVMVWPGMPRGLTREQAIRFFETYIKPRSYEVERFYYHPKTGRTETIGKDKP